ncbi:hypothetical protein LINGRAPRIM_LOCUS533 [Linum grandiflorum]
MDVDGGSMPKLPTSWRQISDWGLRGRSGYLQINCYGVKLLTLRRVGSGTA